jgi:hypothetical protein
MPEELSSPQEQSSVSTAAPVKKRKKHSAFWSFDSLYIVKQLSTALHAITQVLGTVAFFYYIYDSKIYLLILATPIVWILIRFIFEILAVPFVISYDLDKILKKLSENDQ